MGEKLFFTASILILSLVVSAAAITHFNQYTKTAFKSTDSDSSFIVKQKAGVIAKIGAAKAKAAISRLRVKTKRKMITGIAGIKAKTGRAEPVEATTYQVPAVVPVQQALSDSRQAEIDQAEGRKQQQQAEKDREQAENDRKQSEKDRAQAEKDRGQAEVDRAQAMKDQALAVKDQAQAELDRRHAMKDRAKAATSQAVVQ